MENQVENKEEPVEQFDPVKTIQELKENSVPKEEYNKLQNDYKNAINALANGEHVEVEKKEEVKLDDLVNNLLNKESDNLTYITNSLKVREEIMKRGGVDPYVPNGYNIHPTQQDFETADRVARIYQECVDIAKGDSNVFTAELQRRIW